jgi:hypothetical protein
VIASKNDYDVLSDHVQELKQRITKKVLLKGWKEKLKELQDSRKNEVTND